LTAPHGTLGSGPSRPGRLRPRATEQCYGQVEHHPHSSREHYVTKKNTRTMTSKMEKKKYDPVARKHVVFREAKIK